MPRISRLSRSEVEPGLVPLYDQFLRERGNVPYFFRTFAHRPEIMETMFAHMNAVLRTGTLPTRLKELAVLRTSQLNKTAYCLASHTAISLRLGTTPEQIAALEHWHDSPLFSPVEKAAVALAEALTLRSLEYTDQEFADLRSAFTEGEVVELLAAVGLFNYFNRVNNLLQMEPTRPASEEELAEAGLLTASATS